MFQLLDKTRIFLSNLSRNNKTLLIIFFDSFTCFLSIWFAYKIIDEQFLIKSLVLILLMLLIFYFVGIYNFVTRHIGTKGILKLFLSCLIYLLISLLYIKIIDIKIPIFLIIYHSVTVFAIGCFFRIIVVNPLFLLTNTKESTSIMIYGAGMAGRQIAYALAQNIKYNIIGFFDDNLNLHKLDIGSWKVYNPENMELLITKNNVTEIILAIPSLSTNQRYIILKKLQKLKIKIKTLPHLSDILSKKVNLKDIRELDTRDLLNRKEIKPDLLLLKKASFGKTILITGAGGSIGSEISRQLIDLEIKTIILVETSEVSLYKIDFELKKKLNLNISNKSIRIISILSSVNNFDRMNDIVKLWQPDTIYHSAAYKHVPLIENNITEGVVNNIFGTINMANIALKNKIKNFVLISTDKAVRPTNIMGTTKRVSELYLQAINDREKKIITKFSIVRFGNVLDSSGSVVPLFKEQIKSGGPVTVTHKNVERYFMTIPEASQLVIQSTAMAIGGDVFVLGMGNLVKVHDLALKMIELSGLTVMDENNLKGDIKVEFIGLRPGEKMYEELLINNKTEKTGHPKITRGTESFTPYKDLMNKISKLQKQIEKNDILLVKKSLKEIVREFSEVNPVQDIIHNKKLDIS